jgi:hypothetical protein
MQTMVPSLSRSFDSRLRRSLGLAVVTGAVVGLTSACGPDEGGAEGTIERDVFIATYVDLRVSALQTDSQRVSEPMRDSLLAHHGVTVEQLMHFAEANADRVAFMRDVWAEVESELDRPPDEGS